MRTACGRVGFSRAPLRLGGKPESAVHEGVHVFPVDVESSLACGCVGVV